MRVLPWPYWFGNPYLPRTCRALEAHGIGVVRSPWPALGAPWLGAGDWIHFHWPGALLIHRDRRRYARRVDRFARRLDRLAARGVRMAWTVHNLRPHDNPHPDLGRRGRAALLDHVEHLFVHVDGARPLVADELGWRGAVTTIPHGHYADLHAVVDRGAARATLGLRDDALCLLLLGKLRPYKGIAEAVAAFQQVARRDDRLIVAGQPEGDVAAELAAARRDPRVIVDARRLPRAAIDRYHGCADAVVAAHRAVLTSGSAVLALSLGVPVIGAPGPHLDALGPAPRVFATDPAEPDAATALAGAIARRCAHGPVNRDAVRAWARAALSWDVAAARIAAVLRAPAAAGRIVEVIA